MYIDVLLDTVLSSLKYILLYNIGTAASVK